MKLRRVHFKIMPKWQDFDGPTWDTFDKDGKPNGLSLELDPAGVVARYKGEAVFYPISAINFADLLPEIIHVPEVRPSTPGRRSGKS